ncbi:MAG: hypothetical protein IKP95_09565 [Ruminococcus sp.]|nr:hypothetical protein [Ruminococcus sp.]
MTKAQIKAAIQKVVTRVFDKKYNDTTITKLMDLNEQFGSGTRWCSYRQNLIEIIKGGDKNAIDKAFNLYEEYYKTDGAQRVLDEIVGSTNYLNF